MLLQLHTNDDAHRRVTVNTEQVTQMWETDNGNVAIFFAVPEVSLFAEKNEKSKPTGRHFPNGFMVWTQYAESYDEVLGQWEGGE